MNALLDTMVSHGVHVSSYLPNLGYGTRLKVYELNSASSKYQQLLAVAWSTHVLRGAIKDLPKKVSMFL